MYIYYKKIFISFIGLVFFISLVSDVTFGIKVYPTKTDLGEDYYNKQTLVLTLLNDEPGTKEVNIYLSPDSQYLAKYVKFEKTNVVLKTNSKYNLQMDIYFEKDMSPEKHVFEVIALTDDFEEAKSTFEFTVPGVANPNLNIDNMEVEDIFYEDSVYLHINLNNSGNVIARAKPKILIFNSTDKVGELNYQENIMIMPEETYNLSLMYDTSNFPVGKYQVEILMNYNGNLTTNSVTKVFEILKPKVQFVNSNSDSMFNENLLALLLVLVTFFLGVSLFILNINKKKNKLDSLNNDSLKQSLNKSNFKKYNKRIELINKNCEIKEKELGKLVNKTHKFIEKSNKWFSKKYPNENYRFK
jgi:hypothetical protein